MSKDIHISRKTLNAILWTLVMAVVFLAIYLALRARPDWISAVMNRIEGATPTSVADLPDAQAAAAGVTAFYSLDDTVTADTWEAAVCATLTASGCEVFKSLYAPGLRSIVERNHWRTGCTVRAIQKVEADGDRRVWRLEASLDRPLPGSPATFQVYAEVEMDAAGTWRMTHVLNEGEASRFASRMP